MNKVSLLITSKTQLRYGVYCLNDQGVIAHPTDTIYGLSALVSQPKAIHKLLRLKRRNASKGLILLSSSIDYVLPFIQALTPEMLGKIIQKTQQPTTYLIPKSSVAPYYICGQFNTVAVRITSDPIVKFLCQKTHSALLSSSANITGCKPIKNGIKLRQYFANQLDYIISPNQANNHHQPSMIKHLITNEQYR